MPASQVAAPKITPALPAASIGQVLGFLPYRDVHTVLLAGKSIARDSTPYVTTLSICSERELDIPSARRFPNVTNVNIMCLFRLVDTTVPSDGTVLVRKAPRISPNVPSRICPFLQQFPRLKAIFVGMARESPETFRFNLTYTRLNYFIPRVECSYDLYKNLLWSFCGAFRTRSLPSDLTFEDNPLDSSLELSVLQPWCSSPESPLDEDLCREICATFPLNYLLTLNVGGLRDDYGPFNVCLETHEFYEIIRRRNDHQDFARLSPRRLQILIDRHWKALSFEENPVERETLFEALGLGDRDLDDRSDYFFPFYDEALFQELETMLVSGLDPNRLNQNDMLYMINSALVIGGEPDWDDENNSFVWSERHDEDQCESSLALLLRSSYDRFRSLGFPVEEGYWLVVVDDDQYAGTIQTLRDAEINRWSL